jgi:uncharacterized protein (DUF433 family)
MELVGYPRISIDSDVCGGRPVVAGTRLRVTDLLEMLAGGSDVEEIVNDFPYITSADVRACLHTQLVSADPANSARTKKSFHAEYAEFRRGAEIGCGGTHPLENLCDLCVKQKEAV